MSILSSSAKRGRSGFSMVELMIASVLALVIMGSVYQLFRLHWQIMQKGTLQSQLLGESKRLVNHIGRRLRNSGYNPLAVEANLSQSRARFFGLLYAAPEEIIFSEDVVNRTGLKESDGYLNSHETLTKDHRPQPGSTSASEISGFRLHDGRLETYRNDRNGVGTWELMSNMVGQLHFQYWKGEQEFSISGASPSLQELATISAITVTIGLEQQGGRNRVQASTSTNVKLRNRPSLTP